MSLSSDERRSLAGIEAPLRRSDPALAALHDEFSRRSGTSASVPGGVPAGREPVAWLFIRPVAAALLLTLLILAIVVAVQDSRTMELPPAHAAPAPFPACVTPGQVHGRSGREDRPRPDRRASLATAHPHWPALAWWLMPGHRRLGILPPSTQMASMPDRIIAPGMGSPAMRSTRVVSSATSSTPRRRITTVDPLTSIAIPHLGLGERIGSTPPDLAGEAAALAVMTAGITALAHRSPAAAAQTSG